MCRVGCPADAADRPGELALAFASPLSFVRAGTRAVDRHDRRLLCDDKVSDLLAPQPALERQDPAAIDDGDVEALPLSSHINADPAGHKSKHALPSTRAPGKCRGSSRPECRGRVQDRLALLAAPDWRAGRVLTVECPDEYTVLTAVARRGADVRGIVHAPVLGRPWPSSVSLGSAGSRWVQSCHTGYVLAIARILGEQSDLFRSLALRRTASLPVGTPGARQRERS